MLYTLNLWEIRGDAHIEVLRSGESSCCYVKLCRKLVKRSQVSKDISPWSVGNGQGLGVGVWSLVWWQERDCCGHQSQSIIPKSTAIVWRSQLQSVEQSVGRDHEERQDHGGGAGLEGDNHLVRPNNWSSSKNYWLDWPCFRVVNLLNQIILTWSTVHSFLQYHQERQLSVPQSSSSRM